MRHIVNAHWMGLSFTKTATNSGDSLASVLTEAYEWADWAAQETGVPIGEQDIVEVTTTHEYTGPHATAWGLFLCPNQKVHTMSLFALNMIALSMIALTCIVAPFNAHAAELPPQPTAAPMIGHLEPVQPTPVERPDQPEIVLDMVALNESIVSEALATIKDAKQ